MSLAPNFSDKSGRFYQDDAGTPFRLNGTLGLIVLAGAAVLGVMSPFIRRLVERPRESVTNPER